MPTIPIKKNKDKNYTFRVSEEELTELQRLADLYAEGKLAEWIRYASLNFRPDSVDSKRPKKV